MEDWGLRALEGERCRLVGVGSRALGWQCDGSIGAGGGHWEAEDLGDLPLEGLALPVSVRGEIGMCIPVGVRTSGPCCQVPGHSLGLGLSMCPRLWGLSAPEAVISRLGAYCLQPSRDPLPTAKVFVLTPLLALLPGRVPAYP